MKLYLETKLMTFEDGEHEIISRTDDKEFFGYDRIVNSDILSKNEEDIYIVREQETWWSFPLYEFKDDEITPFDYTQYSYFTNTERRMALAEKINILYNPASEFKILRETIAYIMNELHLNFPPDYGIMNTKINEVIAKNPKEEIK